jgi:hypothetical protein
MTDADNLDLIATRLMGAEALNALHACRADHPLGRNNQWKWRNAWAQVAQQKIGFIAGMDAATARAVDWLARQAKAEATPL